MKIGDQKLDHNLFLGPMAGITDKVYRRLCVAHGCEVTCTEMVSAKAVYYDNAKTEVLLNISPDEAVVGVQLFGREPELMAEMAKRMDRPEIDFFDINMGCPVPKIVNNKEGSALMKEPQLVGEIVDRMVKAVPKPISVKIRAGFEENQINAVEIGKIIAANGASHLAIHGRTRQQYYSGTADWEIIGQVKQALDIPVIANGDVFCGQDYLDILARTGCDGVMIGRGAIGNPWIFEECRYAAAGRLAEYVRPTTEQILATVRQHLCDLVDYKGEYIAIREMRKHLSYYTRGIKNAAKLRKQFNQVTSLTAALRLLESEDEPRDEE